MSSFWVVSCCRIEKLMQEILFRFQFQFAVDHRLVESIAAGSYFQQVFFGVLFVIQLSFLVSQQNILFY
jgi:hypothetical protein